jgi:hypothetical protein
MKMKQTIRITCQAHSTLSPQSVEELQGNLKTLTKENYQRLKNVIIKYGFCEPISIWYECDGSGEKTIAWILNGHQRVRTVLEMISEGWECPDLPVNLVEAFDINEARKITLALASQYGQMDSDGLYSFLGDTDLNVDDLMTDYHFADLNLSGFIKGYMDPDPEGSGDGEKEEPKERVCPNCGHSL